MDVPEIADFYYDLGLTREATKQEVTAAFRKLSLKLHPDKNQGREKEFQPKFVKVTLAYEVLSDEDERADYDCQYDEHNVKQQWAKYRRKQRHHEDQRREFEDRIRKRRSYRCQTEDERREKENA